MASRILVEPDRYVLYACPELATAWQANMNRQRELLMIKAGTGTGGQIASSMAYRPEYNQLRGEMVQLRKAAADKNCRAMPSATAPDAVSAPTRAAPSQSDRPLIRGTFFPYGTCWRGTRHRPWP